MAFFDWNKEPLNVYEGRFHNKGHKQAFKIGCTMYGLNESKVLSAAEQRVTTSVNSVLMDETAQLHAAFLRNHIVCYCSAVKSGKFHEHDHYLLRASVASFGT